MKATIFHNNDHTSIIVSELHIRLEECKGNITLLVQKDVDLCLRMVSYLSLTITNLPSFGDFPKIKK